MDVRADMVGGDMTAERLRALARQRLHAEPSEAIFDPRSGRAIGRGDWDLNPDLKADLDAMEAPRPAAVLIGIVTRPVLTVLLTQRAAVLRSHAGQIAFPGGKMEPGETSPITTALREAQEEIGLFPDLVEPLGFLDSYRTGTGFEIAPVVALVQPRFHIRLDRAEVDDVFEVPLGFLMDEANHQQHQREWRGRMRAYYAMPYGERYIWGATAGMIKNLHERLFA
ncbi:MAG: CoA pyrophosphatase [Hyphomicrobiaceae bacterium]